MMHEQHERATSFGEDAEQYDRARPSYAEAMVDDLLADGAQRVVDVGCGTGIVGRLFLARGCTVVGVERDERMAAVARRSAIDVVVTRFEDWDAPVAAFDLLVSGQAWHWVDPEVGPSKAASVLRPGGRFAAFWNTYRHDPEVASALAAVYADVAPQVARDSVVLGTMRVPPSRRDDAAMLEPAGFRDVEHRAYDWDRVYSRDEWVDQLPTHSDHRLLPADVRDAVLARVGAAIDELGGAITVHHSTRLLTARRA